MVWSDVLVRRPLKVVTLHTTDRGGRFTSTGFMQFCKNQAYALGQEIDYIKFLSAVEWYLFTLNLQSLKYINTQYSKQNMCIDGGQSETTRTAINLQLGFLTVEGIDL